MMLAKTDTYKDTNFNNKFVHAFLIYTGAFLFSIIMIVLLHEFGHFLAFRWRGYEWVSIRINPFMGTTSTTQDIQPNDFKFIVLGGTIFNLSVATIVTMLLRFTKSPYFLPARMYPATAFLIEGMVILAGLFFKETITDFAWLISLGWSPIFIGILGVVFIIIGGFLTYEIWILLGFNEKSPRKHLLMLNIPFLLYGLVGFLIGQAISIDLDFLKNFLAACTVLHWMYLGIRIILSPFIMPLIQKRMFGVVPKITLDSSISSLVLGCASWVLSLLILN